jgi:ABC-type phosphate transport system substrate-binding protein
MTFGATDSPLKADKLEKDGLVQWPMVMGAIVPVVNIEGVKAGELVLSGEVLGDIYLGKFVKWDDPAIVNLNPSLKLPSAIRYSRRVYALGSGRGRPAQKSVEAAALGGGKVRIAFGRMIATRIRCGLVW